jgi:hypothetical protein
MFFAMQEHQLLSGSVHSKLILLGIICLQLGCNSRRAGREPSLTLTKLPPFAEGTAYQIGTIEGRVTTAQPGEKIVLYAKSGVWWIQPTALQPFTKIQPDGSWKSETHPGSSYAALLVKDGYYPRSKLDQLPAKNHEVLAVADGPKHLEHEGKNVVFSGYEWKIRAPQQPC